MAFDLVGTPLAAAAEHSDLSNNPLTSCGRGQAFVTGRRDISLYEEFNGYSGQVCAMLSTDLSTLLRSSLDFWGGWVP